MSARPPTAHLQLDQQCILTGVFTLLFEVTKAGDVWKPAALLLQAWECAQLCAFVLSATPTLPWMGYADMSVVAVRMQHF